MKREILIKLHTDFEALVQVEVETGVEFWLARDLQDLLGYASWQQFKHVLEKAANACKNSGYGEADHFMATHKLVEIGSGAERKIDDIALTRYACYLIAQNGDSKKPAISFAQTYFAIQTRKMELIEKRLEEVERIAARQQLREAESELSDLIFERVGDNGGFARIRSKGDHALFGKTTQEMKEALGTPEKRPLADFLPTITIKAKDFATEVTNFNVKENNLQTEHEITGEHVKNNSAVRDLMVDRGIKPEELPAQEDVKKVERRVNTDNKKLPGSTDRLGS